MEKITFYVSLLIIILILNLNGIFYALTGNLAFISPIILIFCILLIGEVFKKNRFRTALKITISWNILLLLYLILGLLGILVSNEYNENLLKSILDVLTTVLIFIALAGGGYILILKYGGNKIIAVFTLILITSVSSIILLEWLGLSHIFNPKSFYYRQSGFFGNPNDAGQTCAYALLFIIFQLSSGNLGKLKKIILITLGLLVIYSAILTLSKAAIATCLFLIFLVFLINLKDHFIKSVTVLSIVLLFFISQGWEYFNDNFEDNQLNRIEELGDLLSGNINEESTTERTTIAAYGWRYIEQNPFIGIGLGNFKSLPDLGKASHNTFLVLWGESGMIPLLFYVFLIGRFVILAFKYLKLGKKNYFLLFSGGAGIIFIYSFATSSLLDNRIFNCVLIILLILSYRDKYKKRIKFENYNS